MTMRIAHITPIPLLHDILGRECDLHLCLSNLVNADPAYASFYRRRHRKGDYIILDSPVFETGITASTESTLRAWRILEPDEIVLPDDLLSADNTIRLSQATCNTLIRYGYTGRFMVVPHANTLDEFLIVAAVLRHTCTSALGLAPIIGLQEEIPELYGITRNQVMYQLRHLKTHFHLLGIRKDLSELTDTEYPCLARSCDASAWVVWGLNGYRITPGDPVQPYPGRESLGGRQEYFHYVGAAASEIATARANTTAWASYDVEEKVSGL
jgi:hypothetical protein